jgi:hypothetical protein
MMNIGHRSLDFIPVWKLTRVYYPRICICHQHIPRHLHPHLQLLFHVTSSNMGRLYQVDPGIPSHMIIVTMPTRVPPNKQTLRSDIARPWLGSPWHFPTTWN